MSTLTLPQTAATGPHRRRWFDWRAAVVGIVGMLALLPGGRLAALAAPSPGVVRTGADTTSPVPRSFPDSESNDGFPEEYLDSTPRPGHAGMPPASAHVRPVRILFLGNSLTYINAMPRLVEALMADGHHPCVVGMVTHEATDLPTLWRNGRARHVIQAYPWDYVVLQERPGETIAFSRSAVQSFAHASVAKHAQLVLYPPYPNALESTAENNDRIAVIQTLAQAVHAALVPIPAAWHAALAADPSLDLYTLEGIHPSLAGAYLNALVFYRMVTGRSPVGRSGPAGLSTQDVATLQQAAEAAFAHRQTTDAATP